MTDEALTAFRSRFEIPIPESAAKEGALYRPADDSPEIVYLKERRKELGGFVPTRSATVPKFEAPSLELISESLAGSEGRPVSTTLGYVSMLRNLIKRKQLSQRVVPIIPDQARTFGMYPIIR